VGGASVDAGIATVRQPAQPRVTAPTLGGEAHLDGARLALRASAGATLAAADRWTAQGELAGSWIAASRGRASWELGLGGSALRYNGAPAASTGSILARQHVDLGAGGLWLGAGGGVLARQGDAAPIGALEVGSWLRASRLRASLTVSLQHARLDTIALTRNEFGVLVRRRFDARLTALDATALATWHSTRLDLTGTAALRRAPRQHDGVLGSALATGAWWLVPQAAVMATGGALAADPLRGLPARHVLMAGLRLRPGGGSAAPRRTAAPLATPAADVAVRSGQRVLRVRAPGATSVDVRGDCTKWQPTPLVRAGDWWELAMPFDPGTQHLVLRIDGGAWRPPANVPSIEDEFGERVGLLVVP